MSEDLIDVAHRARRCLRDHGNVHRKAAKAMGMAEPTFRRHLRVLDFPVEALAAYRNGRISQTLMWKLANQPRDRQEAMWELLRKEGRLKHEDLKALRDEPDVLVRRLQVTVRKLGAAGLSRERILELVAQA